MGEVGHDFHGEKEDVLLLDLPYGGCHMCGLVSLCLDRQDNRGDQVRAVTVALLDQAGGGGHRVCRGAGLHVYPVQGLYPDL